MNSPWISVNEQLPDERWVLVCIEHSHSRPDINMGQYHQYYDGWRTRWGKKFEGIVTHWMPLPELPIEYQPKTQGRIS